MRKTIPMPAKVIALHQVDDVAYWRASPKREDPFDGVMQEIRTFVHPAQTNSAGLSGTVLDMDRFQAATPSRPERRPQSATACAPAPFDCLSKAGTPEPITALKRAGAPGNRPET
jgi:hypothetical protein